MAAAGCFLNMYLELRGGLSLRTVFWVPVRDFALRLLCVHRYVGLSGVIAWVEAEASHPAAGVAVDGVSRNLAASGVSPGYKLCLTGGLH